MAPLIQLRVQGTVIPIAIGSDSVTNWQLGAVTQNMVSFAGDEDRADVNTHSIQPLVNYVAGKWYFGAGDISYEFDWKDRGAMTIPPAFQVGVVPKIGRLHYNFSVAPVVWVKHNGPAQGGEFGLAAW